VIFPTRELVDFEMRLSMVTRNGKEKGEKKKGMRVGIEERRNGKKVWKNRKGREISKVGIDLNNWLQLWDDNPMWVVKNP
jgi:hypothetical protein